MAAFVLKLGALDLSPYVRVHPQDAWDPYGGGDWAQPQFAEAPFAEGRPLLNIDTANREMVWPLFLKGVGNTGTTYAVTVAAISSLVSYWKLDESAGTTANDSKGSNSLTYSGSFTLGATGLLTGDPDTAVSFASGAKAQGATLPANLQFAGAFTISAIVSNAPADGMICGSYNSSDGHGYNLWMNGGSLMFTIRGTTTVSVSVGGKTGTNMHIVGTFDGTTMTLYVNGASVGTNTTTPQTYSNPFQIAGNLQGTNNTNYVGVIDEVFACNAAISAGTVTTLYNIYSTGPSAAVAAKDNLHALVQQIVREINNPTSSPLRVEWKDQGASNSTFYDVTYARWDPHFNYRLSEHAYADGALRIWCQPPYGHTATERVIATAAGTAPGLIASLIGVASPLAGDVAPQLRVTLNTSGEPVGPAGRGVIVAAPAASGYVPFISAASFVNVHPSAGVFGASGAPGSQALYRQPSFDSGYLARVPIGATMYAGRRRVLAAVLPAMHGVGHALSAQDQAGARIGPTAVSYSANGWQLLDLGVVNVATTTPTTTFDLVTGQVPRTLNDGLFQRPLPSGAAASSIAAIAGVYVLPEENAQVLKDKGALPLVRSYFGASGGATALLSQFVGDLGETWPGPFATSAITNASGVWVVPGAGGSWQTVANTRSVRNFHSRVIARLGLTGELKVGIGGGIADDYVYADIVAPAAPSYLLLNNYYTKNTSPQVTGTLVIASVAGMPINNNDLVLDVVRYDDVMYTTARWANATGIAIVPASGAAATVVPVASLGQATALSSRLSAPPWMRGIATVALALHHVDELVNFPQPSEAYAFTSVTGDTPRRLPISGSGPNVDLTGAKIGPSLKLAASSVGVVAVDWQQDGGPMNDPMGVEVRVRERFSYAR